MAQFNADGTLAIVSANLPDFITEIEAATKKGFYTDVSKNDGYPQQIGYMFTMTMYPEDVVEVQGDAEEETKVEEVSEVVAPTRGRPKSK